MAWFSLESKMGSVHVQKGSGNIWSLLNLKN